MPPLFRSFVVASSRQTDLARGDRPLPGPLRLTVRQQRRLWRHIATIENFWETLQEIEPGVVKRLAAVAARSRWEVIFLTKRPATAGRTAQRQAQRSVPGERGDGGEGAGP